MHFCATTAILIFNCSSSNSLLRKHEKHSEHWSDKTKRVSSKENFHMANCLDVILVLMQKAPFAFDAFTRSTFWSGVKGSN